MRFAGSGSDVSVSVATLSACAFDHQGPLVLGVDLLAAFVAVQVWKGDKATVLPRVFHQRTLVSASVFTFLLSAAYFAVFFYIPIWFQAIKGVSAIKSGIMCLPMILSVVVFSLVTGGGITATGHYVLFANAGCILTTVGAGLITTFETDTGHAQWIGYQFLFGAGVGCGIQLGIIASQVVLGEADIPIGTAIITLCQMLGGAISISAAQSIFGNLLGHKMSQTVGEGSNIITRVGATDLKDVVEPRFYNKALEAYNGAPKP
ncbi:ABC transporter [Fusarium sp. NRRL 52700]|nr:ABC transporter [Fusarium sp. NRRL 52700]